jgi:hypothetical protein
MLTKEKPYEFPSPGETPLLHSPVIVGSGPAGLFCGWYLAKAGYCPIILERGEEAEKRQKTVENFWKNGVLDPESNVQFGEGGAGTFSDGKLNTLVPLLKGQIADVYVVLLGETKTGRMRMEHYRNGLRIRCLFDGARIDSTLPVVALCIEHNFFSAIKRDDDVTFSKPAAGSSLQFKQGPSSGIVALTPPSEFKSPQMPPHERFVQIPVDVIRAGLAATAFSSQDPTMSASGVLSSIQMRDGELNVITYDSMCGAL